MFSLDGNDKIRNRLVANSMVFQLLDSSLSTYIENGTSPRFPSRKLCLRLFISRLSYRYAKQNVVEH